ncbi:hypothetical protein LRAMOSA02283 [Lichtheimia ramosa]|uniref:proline--tRNA ligase n=1 Tax=Lichtheimia ramosa TaxID=688394 RepID=A0A077WLI5_9FUNG|nr:hypothetical protein LRAMOSA02283 [Lichtheimia ramosa]
MFMTMTKEQQSADEASTSHGLLLKGGFIRQSASGIYSMLPLGLRMLNKIENIIDQELGAIGSQKLALPLLLSAENWKKTGRWNASKGEFFRLKDRRETEMLLSPTHEEEITQLVANELKSSKQLPIRLYQIGRKYRDEFRPRAGLLRGREFVMKDLYTFDESVEAAYHSYDLVANAYQRIFHRIGVPFVVAEADTGNMGGSKSHEYHLISPAGEDTLLSCSNCGYTANEELAVGKLDDSIKNDTTTVAAAKENQVCKALGLVPKTPVTHSLLRFASLDKEGMPVHQGTAVVLARQGRTINMLKVEKTLTTHLQEQQLFTDGGMIDMTMTETIPSPSTPFHLFIDDSIDSLPHVPDHVITHGPDHFRTTEAGDLCASCHHESSKLTTVKAIEVGHTFYLGTKYSSALGCTFLPEKRGASPKPAEMGCFGIGISRLVATAAEVCHDDRGIVWPSSIAPYRVCIVPTSNNNAQLLSMAESIYDQLENDMNWRVKGHAGSVFYDDVVIDDRKQMFGAKMADAELIGYPFIVVLGKHALETGVVEVNQRIKGQANIKTKVPVDELGSWLFERQML